MRPAANKAAKSIKYLKSNHEEMISLLQTRLKGFLIPETKPEKYKKKEGKEFLCVERAIIFLPPRFHLLMKFVIYEEHTVVKIRTDFWRVLICLDDFFDNLIKR